MVRAVALAVALVAALAANAEARCPTLVGPLEGDAVAKRIDDLAHTLDRERKRLQTYRVGWAAFFAAGTLAQIGLAELVGEPRDIVIYVSAAKAAIGASVTPFLAPRFELPAARSGESDCDRLAALEKTLLYVAKRERRGTAVLQHGLGLALNLAGALYLGLVEDQWSGAIAGALVGTAVGELRLWTQPRGAIRAVEQAGEDRGPWLGVYSFGLGGGLALHF